MKLIEDLLKIVLAVLLMLCMVAVTPLVMVTKWITKGLQDAFEWCIGKE